MDEYLQGKELEESIIQATGNYSGAHVFTRYLLPIRVMEALKYTGFHTRAQFGLDGKHSETLSELTSIKVDSLVRISSKIKYGSLEVKLKDYEDETYDDSLIDYLGDVLREYEAYKDSEDGYDSEGYEVEEVNLNANDLIIIEVIQKGKYRQFLLNYLRYHVPIQKVEVPQDYIDYVKYGAVEEVARRLYLAEHE